MRLEKVCAFHSVRYSQMPASGVPTTAIAFRANQTALGPALLDPARPVLHVAGALRIDRFGGRETVRLQIDDAATSAGAVLA
jgi:single-stranded-DNA-specific exonuclease